MVEAVKGPQSSVVRTTPSPAQPLLAPYDEHEREQGQAYAAEQGLAPTLVGTQQACGLGEQAASTGQLVRQGLQALSRAGLNAEVIDDVQPPPHPNGLGSKLLGGLGAAGGIAQTSLGVQQLTEGQLVEGGKNASSGALATTAGVLEVAAPAALAAKAVPVLAGAAGIVEGSVEVAQAVGGGDAQQGVLGAVKVTGGVLLTAAPFLTGTIVGAPAGAVAGAAGGVLLGGAELVEAIQYFGAAE